MTSAVLPPWARDNACEPVRWRVRHDVDMAARALMESATSERLLTEVWLRVAEPVGVAVRRQIGSLIWQAVKR